MLDGMKGFVALAVVLVACDTAEPDPSLADGGSSGDGGATTDAPAGAGEPANLAGITMLHNQVRADVDTTGISGGPLPPMQWDPALAAYAAQWAAMCQDTQAPSGLIDHNPNRSNVAGYAYIGENIFGASSNASAQGAVNAWASEKANFTYPSTCSGICGHYTQIVWRTSVNLGCALQDCPSLQYRYSIVCNYGPGGNSGGPPY
jgi:pathogenesis-related protein 1